MADKFENFGRLVLAAGLASLAQVEDCIAMQKRLKAEGQDAQLGTIMVDMGYLTPEQVRDILKQQDTHILSCDSCHARYNVSSLKPGKKVKCQRCGAILVVPEILNEVSVDGEIDARNNKSRPMTREIIAELILFDGKKPKGTVPIEKGASLTIGRAKDNKIVVQDNMVSRYHCKIENDGSAFTITDLKSRNGMLINNELVTQHKLAEEDLIQIGNTTFLFRLNKSQASEPKKAPAGQYAVSEQLVCASCKKVIPDEEKNNAKIENSIVTCIRCIRKKDVLVGRIIGGCKVLERIDETPLGNIYIAHQLSMDREVLLKLLLQEHNPDEKMIKRFFREAKVGAQLTHQHIVQLYDMGEAEGMYYILIERVSGKSAAEMIKEYGAIEWHFVVDVALQIADALSFAKQNGIVHRDINPENIFVNSENVAKLVNLGSVKFFDKNTDEKLSESGQRVGTPMNMSPEQIRDPQNVDHRSDIYSLGVTLYHMLTGHAPFEADTIMALTKRILQEIPRPINTLNPAVPAALSQIVARMIAKSPADRYQTADELITDLRKIK